MLPVGDLQKALFSRTGASRVTYFYVLKLIYPRGGRGAIGVEWENGMDSGNAGGQRRLSLSPR